MQMMGGEQWWDAEANRKATYAAKVRRYFQQSITYPYRTYPKTKARSEMKAKVDEWRVHKSIPAVPKNKFF